MAFHMDWASAEKSTANKATHLQHLLRELIVMARGELEPGLFGSVDQLASFRGGKSERLFKINVCAEAEALLSEGEVTLWRRGDVDYVGPDTCQHLAESRKWISAGPLAKLLGHERLSIANSNERAITSPPHRLYVLVGDLAATYDRGP
jgi:hypothetical protein